MNSPTDIPAQPFDRRAIPADARESWWTALDGHSIRLIDWPKPDGPCRGSILFLPGRGDAYEKYLETLEHWRCKGWQVTAADWRGQAFSGRLGLDAYAGHIDDFLIWVDDLGQFWADWKTRMPGPHVLAAHSMGGHLALRATAEGKVDPVALVLSAPMLGLHPGFVPDALKHALARLMTSVGDPRRLAWKWSEKPGQPPEGREKLLTHDHVRYEDEQWWRDHRPQIAMGPASWGWIESAIASIRYLKKPGLLEGVTIPVLFVATREDALVDYSAIARAADRIENARLVAFGSQARHEILREADSVREQALAQIDEFLADLVPISG